MNLTRYELRHELRHELLTLTSCVTSCSRLLAASTASLGLRLRLLAATLRAAALGHRLAHQGELALLRLEAEGEEVLDGLLARRRLTTGNDATLLIKEIALLQTA